MTTRKAIPFLLFFALLLSGCNLFSNISVSLEATATPPPSRATPMAGPRVTALPVVQMQWSNGVFIAGMSAGMHLSDQAQQEYGPMLMLEGRRSPYGASTSAGSISNEIAPSSQISSNKLVDMDEVSVRPVSTTGPTSEVKS